MISGGYFGPLCLLTLKTAAKEGVFTSDTASGLLALQELSSEEVNIFITDPKIWSQHLKFIYEG